MRFSHPRLPTAPPSPCAAGPKTVRDSKNIGFIELSDGSCFKPLQVVFEAAKLENLRGTLPKRAWAPALW